MKSTLSRFTSALLILFALIAVPAFADINTADVENNGVAPAIEVLAVEVNGQLFGDAQNNGTNYLVLERNKQLDITVRLTSYADASDIEVRADIFGFEYNDNPEERLSDATEPFEVRADRTYIKRLTLVLPDVIEKQTYKLRVTVAGPDSSSRVYNYNVEISSAKHDLVIKDIATNPDGEIAAGRSLVAIVRLKNFGTSTERDIKVKVEIPALGVSSQSDYIEVIEPEQSKSSEELLLRIPESAKSGSYVLRATAIYDEGHSKATKELTVTVRGVAEVQPAAAKAAIEVVADGTPKVVRRGEGGEIFPVTISNPGSTAQSFVLEVDGADWATVRMSPANTIVVGPGESKTVYIYVAAKEDAALGEKLFGLNIRSGERILETVNFKASVIERAVAPGSGVRTALEWTLVGLLIVLVIVGIVFAVQKGRKAEEAAKELPELKTENYY